jgi:membrane protease YdiL (CAAX protease family)
METLNSKFSWRDYLGLLVLPGLFLAGEVVKKIFVGSSQTLLQLGVVVIIYTLALAVLLSLQGGVLVAAWRTYRQKLWLKILISLGGMIAMHALIIVSRRFLPASVSSSQSQEPTLTMLSIVLAALPPLIAPFLEELTFRHLLGFKFKDSAWLYPVMIVVSSFLFGLSHLANFSGQLTLTIPYMLVGVFLSLVYAKTKNICYPLGMHLTFNGVNALLPIIIFAFLGVPTN